MSEKFCGEGVPRWAAQPYEWLKFPEPIDAAYPIDNQTGLNRYIFMN